MCLAIIEKATGLVPTTELLGRLRIVLEFEELGIRLNEMRRRPVMDMRLPPRWAGADGCFSCEQQGATIYLWLTYLGRETAIIVDARLLPLDVVHKLVSVMTNHSYERATLYVQDDLAYNAKAPKCSEIVRHGLAQKQISLDHAPLINKRLQDSQAALAIVSDGCSATEDDGVSAHDKREPPQASGKAAAKQRTVPVRLFRSPKKAAKPQASTVAVVEPGGGAGEAAAESNTDGGDTVGGEQNDDSFKPDLADIDEAVGVVPPGMEPPPEPEEPKGEAGGTPDGPETGEVSGMDSDTTLGF